EIESGRFREDLYYRLNVVPIHVPPLRERREDIPMLARHFVNVMAARDGLPRREFTEEALSRLRELEWPGNVRELRNTVERLLILARGDRITDQDVELLVSGIRGPAGLGTELLTADTFQDFRDRSERSFLVHKLREHEWNVSETARVLDMPRSNLYKKIDKYGLTREE
ncbi:MAG: helix-turn-helix domain-containing protein, partial [Gemmatimonadota bacterium]